MATVPKQAGVHPLAISACLMMALSILFAVIGLRGAWGHAEFDMGGIVSGEGDFTLWDINIKSKISIIDLTLPDADVSIDETLCKGDLDGLSTITETCNKFQTIRIFVGLMVLATLAAASCAVISSILALVTPSRTIPIKLFTLLSAGIAFLAAVCAFIALAVAVSMPDSREFRKAGRPGIGSVCTVLVLICSLAVALMQGMSLRKVGARNVEQSEHNAARDSIP